MEGFYGGRVRLDELVAKIVCHVTDFYIPDRINLNEDLRSASMDGVTGRLWHMPLAHAHGTYPLPLPLASAPLIEILYVNFFSKVKMRGPSRGSVKPSMVGITRGL